ncbi:AEC family transporter [Anianabacter salinae]|uniref:AEC family transporter n=1 Tax=Anianabacter salinae TaxID=2851023 RepID=UPI00225E13CF|nr:AEC family transporter [Anianabacter salinae]MBV0913617.1 AEC family transporter [Anianabacter salinae]
MLSVLGITFPIFAAIAIGNVAVWKGPFAPSDMRILGKYVLNIALPALLFNAVATRDLGAVLQPGFLIVMGASTLTIILGAWFGLRLAGIGPARRAIAGLGMAGPNSAYVGYPVLLLALPDVAETVLALNLLVESFLMLPLVMALLDLSRPGTGRGLLRAVGASFVDTLRRPFVIGLIAGLVVSLLRVNLPEPVLRLTSLLGASASALALVVIGGTLYGLPVRGDLGLATVIALGKLVLHPLCVMMFAVLFTSFGLPLSPEMRAAAILSAAMPMLSIYPVLAQPYGHEGIASIALLLATAGAFVTLTVLLAVMG